ncbi:glycine zipper 2TM domain-containing protein [Kangiella shandongensis]|uniref:glycine zipper 2TM domain-containing protein n=1 Tax=Kangiella shandongensis TaxID=2763258 RepID=UPI001CBD95BE|nr:glycine zipper 2TM domain-containing protein [Kangiella shandongensis]
MNIKYPFLLSSLALSMAILPDIASADHRFNEREYRHAHYNNDYARHHAAKGRVISASPVFEYVDYGHDSERVRTCYSERTRYDADDERRNAVIGGVVGGLIGYNIGDKQRHKNVGAVAGAVIGAAVGKKSARGRDSYCETHYEPRARQAKELVGYDVVYKYRGRHYTTFMDYKPGRWIELETTRNYHRRR